MFANRMRNVVPACVVGGVFCCHVFCAAARGEGSAEISVTLSPDLPVYEPGQEITATISATLAQPPPDGQQVWLRVVRMDFQLSTGVALPPDVEFVDPSGGIYVFNTSLPIVGALWPCATGIQQLMWDLSDGETHGLATITFHAGATSGVLDFANAETADDDEGFVLWFGFGYDGNDPITDWRFGNGGLVGAQSVAIPVGSEAPCTASATAQLGASDAEPVDFFGGSVGIDADVAIIGTFHDDDACPSDMFCDSGSASVFRFDAAAQAWVEDAKLTASDAAAHDYFGWAVAVSGHVAVASAPMEDDGTMDTGAAYVYRFDGAQWIQEAKLTASDAGGGDFFGQAVAVAGDIVVVGAHHDDDACPSDAFCDSGSVYVYRFDGAAWMQEAKLTASDHAAGDEFGVAVGVGVDVIVVGARGDNVNGSNSGSAYVYRFDGQTWNQDAVLGGSATAPDHAFGQAVAIDGDVVVVGAPGDDHAGASSGSAYVFELSDGAWVERAYLTASDAAPDDAFGGSVSISGDTLVAGAWGQAAVGPATGAAYAFRLDPFSQSWVEAAHLVAPDPAAGDFFGIAVSISGGSTMIGAWGDDDAGNNAGAVYAFAGLADCNGNGLIDACDIAGGGSIDTDGNGVPDECIAIVASVPPDGAIDARQPSEPDGSMPSGWDGIVLTFDGDAADVTPDTFTVVPDVPGATPLDVAVTTDGDMAALAFLDPVNGKPAIIPPGAWTVVTHVPSGSSVRIGFLPADVGNDGISNANDVLALIDDLNGVTDPPLTLYQTDIDRSGVANANDILRVIDLLNGAGVYDAWNGVALLP